MTRPGSHFVLDAENLYGKEAYIAALQALDTRIDFRDTYEYFVRGELCTALISLVAAYERAVAYERVAMLGKSPRLDGIVAALQGATAAFNAPPPPDAKG